MVYVHPAFMVLVLLLACYVQFLGVARVRFNHFKQRVMFQWKRHAALGKLALYGFALGAAGGGVFTALQWGGVGNTGWHFHNTVWLILPMCVIGFATGQIMDARKKPRTWLPLLHGVNNLLLVLSAVCQLVTGWKMLF